MTATAWTEATRRRLGILNTHRDDVINQVEGLEDSELRRPIPGTEVSALTVLGHLAVSCERFWFRGVVAGEREVVRAFSTGSPAVPADLPADDVLRLYCVEIMRSNAIIAATQPGTAPRWWPADELGPRPADVGDVLSRAILETAHFAGQLSAARTLLLANRPPPG